MTSGRTFKAQVGIDKIQQAVGAATEQILLNKMDGDQAAGLLHQSGDRTARARRGRVAVVIDASATLPLPPAAGSLVCQRSAGVILTR